MSSQPGSPVRAAGASVHSRWGHADRIPSGLRRRGDPGGVCPCPPSPTRFPIAGPAVSLSKHRNGQGGGGGREAVCPCPWIFGGSGPQLPDGTCGRGRRASLPPLPRGDLSRAGAGTAPRAEAPVGRPEPQGDRTKPAARASDLVNLARAAGWPPKVRETTLRGRKNVA